MLNFVDMLGVFRLPMLEHVILSPQTQSRAQQRAHLCLRDLHIVAPRESCDLGGMRSTARRASVAEPPKVEW